MRTEAVVFLALRPALRAEPALVLARLLNLSFYLILHLGTIFQIIDVPEDGNSFFLVPCF
jgi:hypothetical protein